MEVYFQFITDAEGVQKACAELETTPFIGFDTETTELDPYRGDIRLVQLSDGRKTQVIDLKPFAMRGDLREAPKSSNRCGHFSKTPHGSRSPITQNLTRNGSAIISASS